MAQSDPSIPSGRSSPARLAAIAALALLAALLTLLATSSLSPARAILGVDATCTNTGTMHFDPGLQMLTPHRATFSGSGTFFPCVSTTVVEGHWNGSGIGVLSCTGGSGSATMTVDWKLWNGRHASSTVEFEFTAIGADGGAGLASEGEVVAGLFAGDHYTSSFNAAGVDVLDCLTADGMDTAVGAGAAIFSKP